ncbi:MAG: hypothetical protein LBB61_00405 [Treponema sp.]|jgi:hypothetical protein|nr:hypothetical protein [Treponema sp.]
MIPTPFRAYAPLSESVKIYYKDTSSYTTKHHTVTTGYKGVISGYNDTISGYKGVISGYNDGMSGYKGVITGYNDAVSGYKEIITGYNDGMSGYKDVPAGERRDRMKHEELGENARALRRETEGRLAFECSNYSLLPCSLSTIFTIFTFESSSFYFFSKNSTNFSPHFA